MLNFLELDKPKLPSWFFACGVLTKSFLCLKLDILTFIMLFVCTVGDRPESELYGDFCRLAPPWTAVLPFLCRCENVTESLMYNSQTT